LPEPPDFDLSTPRTSEDDPEAPRTPPRPDPTRGDIHASIGPRDGGRSEGDVKELRVKIDVSYHLKLHALKLLRNKKMSDAIEEALDHYFEHVVNEQQALEGDAEMRRLF